MKNSSQITPRTGPPPHDEAYAAGFPPPGEPREKTIPGNTPETKRRKLRALVVDDAPDVAEMLTILLRHAGYEVETALSARAALAAARNSSFDVIVSDIGMPEMNGYELAEQLRVMPEYATTPMVAVTGFTMYDDRERALTAGFDGFLTKPINTRDLVDILERLQQRR
jgi:two-component system, chemotaxis family, CheB/CheR fusion protein